VHCDDQGFYYLDGRIKNVVISGGENIYPEEISEIINRHPQVLESCCFGVEHSEWGEILVAAVVPKGDFHEEEMIDWIEGQLSHYKTPRKWLVQDALPRGPSGKVLVPELRQRLEQQSSADATGNQGNICNRIFAIAAATFKVSPSGLSDESSPETTRGWDSLAHVKFLLALETEFKLKLSSSDITDITDLRAAREKIETLTG
jgi:long-chain acyl-CoA synthetase